MDKLSNDISRVLFSQSFIEKRVREIGVELSRDFLDKNPVMICILRGAVIFLSDLMRYMTIPLEIDFMSVSSYGKSTVSSGVVQIRKDIDIDITKRHVIVVEDIVDSCLSLQYILGFLEQHNPSSITTCVLLNKPSARKVQIKIDYIGFEIENDFVVGYGLDFADKYRNLPYIGILKEEIYK